MFEPTVRLSEEQIDRIAERVAERLREPTLRHLIDAATLAGQLGVSRDFVYAHARELGGKRIGTGRRGRLRFDSERALAAWASQPHGVEHRAGSRTEECSAGGRRRRRNSHNPKLLPVRGEARTLSTRGRAS